MTAGELRIGDRIRQPDGSYGVVERIKVVEEAQVMYDLSIAETHTYFVGQGQWLVHNCSPSKILGDNLVSNGYTRPRGTAAHHIVAYSDSRAAPARTILAREGIDINAATNGVFTSRF